MLLVYPNNILTPRLVAFLSVAIAAIDILLSHSTINFSVPDSSLQKIYISG